jgi:hypothetical protein
MVRGLARALNRSLLAAFDVAVVHASSLDALHAERDGLRAERDGLRVERDGILLRPDMSAAKPKVSLSIRRMARLLRPYTVVKHRKIRVGQRGDGGYVMLDDLRETKKAYSLGVGKNVSWDLDLAERGIPVHQFDHTVEKSPISHPNFCFHRRKITPVGTLETDDLCSILNYGEAGHAILKMDIDGDEWDVLDQTDGSTLDPFTQIICEFHWFGRGYNEDWLQYSTRVLNKLNARFQVVHVHANNCAPYALIAGIPLPAVLEVTYANRRLYEFQPTTEMFPSNLDSPNNPNASDYFLGHFEF